MGVYLAKPKTDKLSEEGGDLSQMLSAFGVSSMQGWRQTMEDAHIAVPSLKQCCPGAVEALRALEQEQRKEERERKLDTQEKRKEVSFSGRIDTADEEQQQQSKRRPKDAKQETAEQEVSGSSSDREQHSSEQRTIPPSEDQTADRNNNSQHTQDAVPDDISLYAVFDGHASNAVSCWVSDHYIKIFADCLQRVQQEAAQGHMPEGLAVGPPEAVSIFNLRNAAICEALQQSFLEVDEQMQKEDNRRALKKYYEEGQMEQKDDETYIQKYLNDGGDVRLVEMEGQKFLQFVPKTNEEEDELAHKDMDDHGGDGSTSPVAASTPVVEDLGAQDSQSASAAAEEQLTQAGPQQEGEDAQGKEGKDEEKVQGKSEPPFSVDAKDAQSSTDASEVSSSGPETSTATPEKAEPAGEKSTGFAGDESSSGVSSAARHITRFNSTADVTALGDTVGATERLLQAERSQQTPAEDEKKQPEEEKKRMAEQVAGDEDVEMEDAQTKEERKEGATRERRRRKEDIQENQETEKDVSDSDKPTGATASVATAAQKEEAGTDEKHTSEEDGGAGRADSGDDDDDDDDDDDVFGRREGTNEGENTPLFAHPSTPEGSGATAVVVLVVGGPEPVVVTANAGDSRGVICRGGQAFPLSHDHKPTNPDEKARIFAAGGSVTNGRVDGNLNLSRAVGDLFYKRNREVPAKAQRITAFPDVRITRVCEEDEFLILACDGIWDCKTNQEAVDFVRERLQRAGTRDTATLRRICEELCDDCLAEDPLQSEGHGCDNMTCLVVELSSHARKHRPGAVKQEEKIVLYGGGDDKYLGCEEKQFESDDNEE